MAHFRVYSVISFWISVRLCACLKCLDWFLGGISSLNGVNYFLLLNEDTSVSFLLVYCTAPCLTLLWYDRWCNKQQHIWNGIWNACLQCMGKTLSSRLQKIECKLYSDSAPSHAVMAQQMRCSSLFRSPHMGKTGILISCTTAPLIRLEIGIKIIRLAKQILTDKPS